MEKLYKVKEVAEAWGVDKSYIYRLIRAELIPHIFIGGAIRLPERALQRWLDDNMLGNKEA